MSIRGTPKLPWARELQLQLAAAAHLARQLSAKGDAPEEPLSLVSEEEGEPPRGVVQLSPQAFARTDLLMLAESETIPWTVGRGDMVRARQPATPQAQASPRSHRLDRRPTGPLCEGAHRHGHPPGVLHRRSVPGARVARTRSGLELKASQRPQAALDYEALPAPERRIRDNYAMSIGEGVICPPLAANGKPGERPGGCRPRRSLLSHPSPRRRPRAAPDGGL